MAVLKCKRLSVSQTTSYRRKSERKLLKLMKLGETKSSSRVNLANSKNRIKLQKATRQVKAGDETKAVNQMMKICRVMTVVLMLTTR